MLCLTPVVLGSVTPAVELGTPPFSLTYRCFRLVKKSRRSVVGNRFGVAISHRDEGEGHVSSKGSPFPLAAVKRPQ